MDFNLNGIIFRTNRDAPYKVNKATDSNSQETFYYLSSLDDPINCILSLVPSACPAVFDEGTAIDLVNYFNVNTETSESKEMVTT